MPGVQVRTVRSLDELAQAERLLADTFEQWTRIGRGLTFYSERFSAEADLMAVAVDDGGRVVGTALGHTSGDSVTLGGLVVAPELQRRGLGSALVAVVEEGARRRGATSVALGSVDESVGFYLRQGYRPLLLIQFAEPRDDVEDQIRRAIVGPLAGLESTRGEFNGMPQLFVQVPSVDFDLKRRLEADLEGCSVSFMMLKDLHAP